MIPKIIWQTYKDNYADLPLYIKQAINTWSVKNPEYEHRYMSDKDAADFILKMFGEELHHLFLSFPVGAMKADLWRYCVIYALGGVYADVDTICMKPIRTWMKAEYEFIVARENDENFCQWTFAGQKNNVFCKKVIDLVVQRNKTPMYGTFDFVHKLTGPTIFTEGIKSVLELSPSVDILNFDFSKYQNFYCYQNSAIFYYDCVVHLFGSRFWKDGYVSWLDQRNLIYDKNGFYSYKHQDVELLQHVHFQKNGYFVEIGAGDGMNGSNTYVLEKTYEWNGVIVEPHPVLFQKCKENRSCVCVNVACYDEEKNDLELSDCDIHSAVRNCIKQYPGQIKNPNFISVKAKSLNQILLEVNAPTTIDYLSVDTNGSEWHVLKSVDFNTFHFRVIHVEHNYDIVLQKEIRQILEKNNYVYVHTIKGESIDMYSEKVEI